MSGLFDHPDLARWRVDPPVLRGGLYSLLREVSVRHPTKVVLETIDGIVWSYEELAAAVERCRKGLAACGVAQGDRVLGYVEKSPANVFLYLACLSHGAVYIPANPGYTRVELGDLIKDARPLLVVHESTQVEPVGERQESVALAALHPDGTIVSQGTPPKPKGYRQISRLNGGDPAVILYTSGTTGSPRGAVLTHRALAANALALCRVWGFRSEDILVHALPLFHTHGLLVALHCALLAGSSILFMRTFDAAAAIELFSRATVFMGVPTYYTRLLAHPALSQRAASGMRLFTCGSAPLLPQVWEAFRKRCGHRIVERYGMTEVGIITSNPFGGEQVPGTVGFPLEGVEIKVVDEIGAEVGPGVTGELCARSAGAFQGYWDNPVETAKAINSEGWVATGDLAVLDTYGRVALEGRSKELIITGGLNVHPLQVEGVLNSLPGVVESAVFGVPHPDFGEGVVASVVCKGDHPPSPPQLRRLLVSRLAGYKLPKRILITESLPRNAMGKVQKTVLRSQHASLFS